MSYLGSSDIPILPDDIPAPSIQRKHALSPRPSLVQMDSGRVRVRPQYTEMVETISVQWILTDDQYAAFEVFFKDTLENGSLPWVLITYDPSPVSHMRRTVTRVVSFLLDESGGYPFTHEDNVFRVSAVLEVLDDSIEETSDPFDPNPGGEDDLFNLEYAECKEEFSFTFKKLKLNVLYTLQIATGGASGPTGPWYDHIPFVLWTNTEQNTLAKKLTINNDYKGKYVFRLGILFTYSQGSGSVPPGWIPNPSDLGYGFRFVERADIDPPEISINYLKEITRELEDFTGREYSLYLSSLDPLKDPNELYARLNNEVAPNINASYVWGAITKKYIGQWIRLNQSALPYDENNPNPWNDHMSQKEWGDMSGTLFTFANQIVVNNVLPPGHFITYTRDKSDPQRDTKMLAIDGVPMNVAPYRDDFSGVIKIRQFSPTCRSPYVMVAIDKAVDETPTNIWNHTSHGISGYCDLPRIDINGHKVRSGLDCEEVYGGTEGLKNHVDSVVNSLIAAGDEPTVEPGVVVYKTAEQVEEETDYLGYINHYVFVGKMLFDNLEWNRSYAYAAYPYDYNWVSYKMHSEAYKDSGIDAPDTGDGLSVYGAHHKVDWPGRFGFSMTPDELESWNTHFSNVIQNNWPWFLAGGVPPNDYVWMEEIYYLFSILPRGINPRNLWVIGLTAGGPVVPNVRPPDPSPGLPGLLRAVEPWEEYGDTSNADDEILARGDGWGPKWEIHTFFYPGYDLWEDYDDGPFLTGDSGEEWGDRWMVVSYADIWGVDTFETYADGAYYDDTASVLHDGTGWLANDDPTPIVVSDDFWQLRKDAFGLDDFEAYTAGTFVPDSTKGSNWDFATAWVAEDWEAADTFETYADGPWTTGSAFPLAWTNGWVLLDYQGSLGVDDFESYSVGAFATGSGGTNWTNAWLVTTYSKSTIADPTVITGLQIWLDAMDLSTLYQDSALTTPVVADGDPVGGWKDKSGHNYHALQATSTKRPLYKINRVLGVYPSILFDGTDDFLDHSAAAGVLDIARNVAGMTMIAMVRKVSGAAQMFIWAAFNNTTAAVRSYCAFNQFSADQLTVGEKRLDSDGGAWKNSVGLINNTWYQYQGNLNYASASAYQYVNGANNPSAGSWGTAGNTSNTASGRVVLGSTNIPGNLQCLNGEIAELIVYNKSLSTTERDQIEGYLRNKYDLF